jgi:hypothetical protein
MSLVQDCRDLPILQPLYKETRAAMRRDVLELRGFYASARGRAAREMLSRKIVEAWGDAAGLDVLGLGYATPLLDPLRARSRRVVASMPAAQGVEVWPVGSANLALLSDEFSQPFPNALFDRVLCGFLAPIKNLRPDQKPASWALQIATQKNVPAAALPQ